MKQKIELTFIGKITVEAPFEVEEWNQHFATNTLYSTAKKAHIDVLELERIEFIKEQD